MNRRGFFGLLAGAAATAIALPELELLIPKRTIFLPPIGGWMRGNLLLTPAMIANEALRVLSMNIEFMSSITREHVPGLVEVSQDGGKTFHPLPVIAPGSVRIVRPFRYASQEILV